MNDNVFDLAEAAEQLGVSYRTALKYVTAGVLKGIRRGGRWKILQSELERFEKEGNAKGEGK